MAELHFQYSTSTALASKAIRMLTRSRFSHIDLVLPDEGLLGASGKDDSINDPGGVIVRPFNAWPYLTPPKVASVWCSDLVRSNVISFARTQIGRPFDKLSLYHFLRDRVGLPNIGRDWRDPGQWFCSELIIRAAEAGGLFTYPLIVTKDTISPQDTLLLFNPYMRAENIAEFL